MAGCGLHAEVITGPNLVEADDLFSLQHERNGYFMVWLSNTALSKSRHALHGTHQKRRLPGLMYLPFFGE